MNLYLGYPYLTGLSQNEAIAIDIQISRNKKQFYIFVRNFAPNLKNKIKNKIKNKTKFVRKFASNLKNKTKKIIIVGGLGFIIWFSNIPASEAVNLSMSPRPMVIVQRSYEDTFELRTIRRVTRRKNNITYNLNREGIYLRDRRIYLNQKVLKLTKELRGGSFDPWDIATILAYIVKAIIAWNSKAEGFRPDAGEAGWRLHRQNPFQPHGAQHQYPPYYDFFFPRKTTGSIIGHHPAITSSDPEFGSLTKSERRQLPNINDKQIKVEGHTELIVGFEQSKYKVSKHGAIHDLPYTVKDNGQNKTVANNENTFKMMDSIVNMPNRKNVKWFEDGMFQGGTERGLEAIHIYDQDTGIIAVFNKLTRRFLTTCQLTEDEHDILMVTGNFITKKALMNLSAPNVSSLNQSFTPINSFANDIMRITPIDPSQFNNP